MALPSAVNPALNPTKVQESLELKVDPAALPNMVFSIPLAPKASPESGPKRTLLAPPTGVPVEPSEKIDKAIASAVLKFRV